MTQVSFNLVMRGKALWEKRKWRHCGKRENAGYQHFPFSTSFPSSYSQGCENKRLLGKGLIYYQKFMLPALLINILISPDYYNMWQET